MPFRFASAFLNDLHLHPFLLNNSPLGGEKKKILQLVSTPNTDDKKSWKHSLKKHQANCSPNKPFVLTFVSQELHFITWECTNIYSCREESQCLLEGPRVGRQLSAHLAQHPMRCGDALCRIPWQMVTQALLAGRRQWEGRPSPSEKAPSIDPLVVKF